MVVGGVHLAVVAVAGLGGCCVQWPGGWVVPEAVAAAWWWWWWWWWVLLWCGVILGHVGEGEAVAPLTNQ